MSIVKRLLLPLLLLLPLHVYADDGRALAALQDFVDGLETLQADFTQTVLNDELEPVRESVGTFKLDRPGRFRWDYTAPFEQVIVGDGENLWTYDPELEQVTVKPMQETLASSPASLLTGTAPIEDEFNVREIGASGELYWIGLTPRVADTDFERVRVALRITDSGGQLDTMELLDNLGQTTRIRFENVKRNAPIDASAFEFTPPEGADVIGQPVAR